ncbi:putative DBINO protein [Hordeum vulgare]|nr:putative DBINO protein [Hordeum vulgare]
MADAHPNSGGSAVDQPGMAKKKKAKCTPEEIAKMDTESVKKRNQRAVVKDNAAARKFAAERDGTEARGARPGSRRRRPSSTKRMPSSCLAFVIRPVSLQRPSARRA